MSRLPSPRSALRALALRTLLLWTLVHALYVAVLAMTRGAQHAAGMVPLPLAPNPLWVTVMCTALLLADVRRRGERALWGNLGLSTVQIAALGVVVCVAGEAVVTFALR